MQGAAAIPEDTLLYAIGDVHGCAGLLDELLSDIEADAQPADADRRILLFVGDYIDRGPDSAGVIARIARGLPHGFEAICLKGNHEALMLDFMAEPEKLGPWLLNGAITTLASYGVDYESYAGHPEGGAACRDALARAMPEDHVRFLDGLRLTAQIGDYFFAHAGVRPGMALDAQDRQDLIWIRDEFLRSNADFGKIVVHGHTPRLVPEIRANRIGIDTGAWQSGVLTALRLQGNSREFLATGSLG